MMHRAALVLVAILILPATAWAQSAEGDRLASPDSVEIDPDRFGEPTGDMAYGAFQRGHYLTALELALPRAEAGNAAAQTLVGEIHSRGLGVPRDQGEAARWYELAAEQGIDEAQFQLAMILLESEVVQNDGERALGLLQRAANAGHANAQFNLAQLILSENAGTAEIEQAVAYYEMAAESGVADAQYALALAYYEGLGGKPHDINAAHEWMERAARQNFDSAQVQLGTWLVEGHGGVRDHEAGFSWMLRAARMGNVAAQIRIARLFRAGIGIEADPVQAATWYMLARQAGLTDPVLEDHLLGLTDEQTEQATGLLEQFR